MESTLIVILLTILRLGIPLAILLGIGELVRRRSERRAH